MIVNMVNIIPTNMIMLALACQSKAQHRKEEWIHLDSLLNAQEFKYCLYSTLVLFKT